MIEQFWKAWGKSAAQDKRLDKAEKCAVDANLRLSRALNDARADKLEEMLGAMVPKRKTDHD